MYLRIKGELFSTNMVREIEWITKYAILCFGATQYDKDKGIISLPIRRCKIRTIKRKLLATTYKHDRMLRVPALITIRNVLDCTTQNNFDNPTICEASMLFGLGVDIENRKMCMGSLEENSGKQCYSLELTVSEIDIEIRDEGEPIQYYPIRRGRGLFPFLLRKHGANR